MIVVSNPAKHDLLSHGQHALVDAEAREGGRLEEEHVELLLDSSFFVPEIPEITLAMSLPCLYVIVRAWSFA